METIEVKIAWTMGEILPGHLPGRKRKNWKTATEIVPEITFSQQATMKRLRWLARLLLSSLTHNPEKVSLSTYSLLLALRERFTPLGSEGKLVPKNSTLAVSAAIGFALRCFTFSEETNKWFFHLGIWRRLEADFATSRVIMNQRAYLSANKQLGTLNGVLWKERFPRNIGEMPQRVPSPGDRPRGYRDHGSKRPDHQWIPTASSLTTEKRDEDSQQRSSPKREIRSLWLVASSFDCV